MNMNENQLDDGPSCIPLGVQMEQMLRNAITMTEMGMDMKERLVQGDKYICYLRTVTLRATKNLHSLQHTCNQFLTMAHRLVTNGITVLEHSANSEYNTINTKLEYEKLLQIIEKELCETDEQDSDSETTFATNTHEKIKYLEARQKIAENAPSLHHSCSVKSVKSDVDEKYPENWSRDSLIDLNNVVNLPPVPEDIFTCFNSKQPTRTSSLSSLKGMRKVKLFLQRAASNSDDEDSSDLDDTHDIIGDNDICEKSNKKLCNITEESHQE
ncbi:uncharacterized protein [Atheta coriaria]|uniref:uncharacterized protein n=1 Tax=Dalotia coriaria TaxID=877792 RepID=UPI0031F45364